MPEALTAILFFGVTIAWLVASKYCLFLVWQLLKDWAEAEIFSEILAGPGQGGISQGCTVRKVATFWKLPPKGRQSRAPGGWGILFSSTPGGTVLGLFTETPRRL